MPAPPMNQNIILHVTKLQPNGQPELNRNGQVVRLPNDATVRVKLSGETIFTENGERADAVMELTTPAELKIQTGDIVEWIDEFAITHKGPIVKITESRSWSGQVIYFRKAWTT